MGVSAAGGRVVAVGLIALAACSGNKTRAIEDAKRSSAGDATRASDATAEGAGDAAIVALPTGDVHVRIEWPDVPVAARTSPGKTPCGTARPPSVEPTTTWALPDVVVWIDGVVPSTAVARLRLAECVLTPRIVVGATAIIDSGADRPETVSLRRAGRVADPRAIELGAPRMMRLPVVGHRVEVALDADTLYELRTDRAPQETAWIVATSGVITDARGVAAFRDVAVGAHQVRAWLPPRAGQPARHGRGELTVVTGELAELTIVLAP